MGNRGPQPTGATAISIRLLPDVRRRIDAEAEASGKSISKIVNDRLAASFAADATATVADHLREALRLLDVPAGTEDGPTDRANPMPDDEQPSGEAGKGDRPSAMIGRPSAASGEAATSEGQN